MVYTSYTPMYYTSLHDSIASICKSILPFSFKRRRIPAIVAAEQRLSKQQSDNLKWQQDSFHQILKLMGLCKESILPETEVSAFRSHLLKTLIALPSDYEQPILLRDKLVFLQELLYAQCISEDEYHSSKRPLLQRLAVQGVEIEARDIVVFAPKESSEECPVIDLKEEKCKESSNSKTKPKNGSSVKKIFGFTSSHKSTKGKEDKGLIDPGPDNFALASSAKNELGLPKENPFGDSHVRERESETQSILMSESLPPEKTKVENRSGGDKGKKNAFRTLFQKEEKEGYYEQLNSKSAKKQWGFDGLKKWKRIDSEDETAPLPLSEKSDSEAFLGLSGLVSSPVGEWADTKQIKRKLHSNGSPSDFFIDKVYGDKIKKELSRIHTELNAKNPNLQFSNDQIEAISTTLPVDKADLKNFFPKSWCDRHGDVVLDVVRKEFKDHVGEMDTSKNATREKHNNSSKRWTTFDDDENCHPNLFSSQDNSFPMKQAACFKNNPFFPDYDQTDSCGNKQRSSETAFMQNQNPFWTPTHVSSMLG
ncbi:Histone H2A.Z-specific chaperone like [Actinidia chinensis var. chinensis]|uniref:Histone H2A.Z-specific chaperone like n=1 Tax=Actinidia chinensis var. chinensis TaxID=1590841 RepID=A0A2R6S1L9_ACTCC|nr:Histone H2A.Z-specific chaperone like [Actinidia chinensis var. chinensis]